MADLTGEILDNRYELLNIVATGGMASIYKALDLRLDRFVAVKIMHPHLANDEEFVNRFIREAKAIAALSHPNIVGIQDQGWNEGGTPAVFIVMEYVDGFTLRDLLIERGPLTPRELLRYMVPVVSALATAHNLGINHRDLKPENILVSKDGRVKIADFGLARGALLGGTMTVESSVVLGSVSYLSPEQVQRGVSDSRSDIYSLGIMFFELLTGQKPYDGQTPIQIAFRHVNERVPAPSTLISGIPASLDAMVLKATSVNPDHRYRNAEELLDELRKIETELDPTKSQMRLDLDLPVEAPKSSARQNSRSTDRTNIKRAEVRIGNTIVNRVKSFTEPTHLQKKENTSPTNGIKSKHNSDVVDADSFNADSINRHESNLMSNTGAMRRKASRRVRRNRVIALVLFLILIGVGWYELTGVGSGIAIPSVAGLYESDAKSAITALGLLVKVSASEYDSAVPAGEVISSIPGGGDHLKKGGTVSLVLSLGPQIAPIPTPTPTTPTPTPTNPTPSSTNSSSPTPVASASPISVPSYVGLTSDQAQNELSALGFTVNQIFGYSQTVPAGDVISQSPDGSTPVQPGSTITLTVSQGSATVYVPNVYSLSQSAATTELQNLQLKVAVRGSGKHVVAVSPKVGSQVNRGSTVVISLG